MNAERSGRPTSRDVLDRSGGAPPAPASNRRILPNRERCLLDTHVAPPHTCVLSPPTRGAARSSPPPPLHRAHAGHAAWAVRAHARSTYKKSARTSYTFYGAYTLAAGRGPAGGAVRKKHTHARHRAIHATRWRLPTSSGRMHRHEGATRRRPARRRHKNYSNDEDMHISSSFDIRGAHGSASHRAQSLSGRAARPYAAAPSWPSSLQVTPSPPPSPPPFSPRGSGEG